VPTPLCPLSYQMASTAAPDGPPKASVLTGRALVLGSLFAAINSSLDMYSNFRAAGGLKQYWVIVASYFIFRGLDRWAPAGSFLHPKDFDVREHGITTIIATAASFSQALGLSGGIAPLQMFQGPG
jgi:hypothetical protein